MQPSLTCLDLGLTRRGKRSDVVQRFNQLGEPSSTCGGGARECAAFHSSAPCVFMPGIEAEMMRP